MQRKTVNKLSMAGYAFSVATFVVGAGREIYLGGFTTCNYCAEQNYNENDLEAKLEVCRTRSGLSVFATLAFIPGAVRKMDEDDEGDFD